MENSLSPVVSTTHKVQVVSSQGSSPGFNSLPFVMVNPVTILDLSDWEDEVPHSCPTSGARDSRRGCVLLSQLCLVSRAFFEVTYFARAV